MKKTPAAVLVYGLLILGIAAGCGCSRHGGGKRSSPGGVVENFITSFQQKDLAAIGELYLTPQLSPEEKEFLTELFKVIEIKSFQVNEVVQLSEREAEVKMSLVMVIYNREKTTPCTFRVIKKDRHWYLSSRPQ